MAANSNKAILAALGANTGIAAAKFAGFVVTRSASMLAESIHSVADASNQGLLLLGGARARRQPTTQHPFGYGRERYFWSFVVAVVLFTLGSAFAVYEGISKIRHPHELSSPGWAVGILLTGIVLEGFSFRTAIVEANTVRGDAGWWRFVRTSRSPELPVVLLEDLGALVGLCVALAGVGLAVLTGDPVWDGVGTLGIGILLGVIAVILAIEMKSLLIGESATPADQALITSVFARGDGISEVLHLKTIHLGPEEIMVGAQVRFDPGLSGTEVAQAISRVENEVRSRVPAARVIYIEPAPANPAGEPPDGTGGETVGSRSDG